MRRRLLAFAVLVACSAFALAVARIRSPIRLPSVWARRLQGVPRQAVSAVRGQRPRTRLSRTRDASPEIPAANPVTDRARCACRPTAARTLPDSRPSSATPRCRPRKPMPCARAATGRAISSTGSTARTLAKNVACVSCHSIHDSKDAGHAKLLNQPTTTAVCITYHQGEPLRARQDGPHARRRRRNDLW